MYGGAPIAASAGGASSLKDTVNKFESREVSSLLKNNMFQFCFA
jgi:hypothetical protein